MKTPKKELIMKNKEDNGKLLNGKRFAKEVVLNIDSAAILTATFNRSGSDSFFSDSAGVAIRLKWIGDNERATEKDMEVVLSFSNIDTIKKEIDKIRRKFGKEKNDELFVKGL